MIIGRMIIGHMIFVTSSFPKSSVFKMVSIHMEKHTRRFQIPQNAFEKLRFRDGLVWTVGLGVEIKLRFQFFFRRSIHGDLSELNTSLDKYIT